MSQTPSALRRVEADVVDVLRLAADAAAAEPLDQRLQPDVEHRHAVDRAVDRRQHLVQRLGLGQRAREAVQHEPGVGVGLRQPLADHADDDRRRAPGRRGP